MILDSLYTWFVRLCVLSCEVFDVAVEYGRYVLFSDMRMRHACDSGLGTGGRLHLTCQKFHAQYIARNTQSFDGFIRCRLLDLSYHLRLPSNQHLDSGHQRNAPKCPRDTREMTA